jgi:hypothetical protein
MATTVEQLYTQVLGRQPDAEGLAFWKSAFGDTVSDAERNSFMQSVNTVLAADPTKTATLAPNVGIVNQAYETLGRTGVGTGVNQIDQGGQNYFLDKLASGELTPDTFNTEFYKTVGDYYTQKPNDAITQYTAPILQENAYKDILTKAYGGIGRTGFGTDVKQIDQGGYDFWLNAMKSGQYNTDGKFDPNKFLTNFNSAVSQYKVENPTTPLTKYVTPFQPVTADKITSNMLVNALNPTGIATPTTPVGQFRELFPAFSESQRLAKEMVTNRPSLASIITMLQGQGQQAPAGQATTLSNVMNTISK